MIFCFIPVQTLVGALRRERITEMEVQKLKAEIEQMSCLVCVPFSTDINDTFSLYSAML